MNFLKTPICNDCYIPVRQCMLLLFFSWLLFFTDTVSAQQKNGQIIAPAFTLLHDSARIVDGLNQRALWYQPRQLDSCYFYVDSALKMSTRLHYARGKATAYKVMGNYYAFTANKYLSYRFYLDAKQAYEALKDTVNYCTVLMNLGIYFQKEGEDTLAREAHYKAMELGSKLQNDSTYGLVLANYYYVHWADSTKSDSLSWALAKAREIATRYHDAKTLLYIGLLDADNALKRTSIHIIQQRLDSIIAAAIRQGFTYMAMYGCMQVAGYKSMLHQADSILYNQKMVDLAIRGSYKSLIIPVVQNLYAYYKHRKMTATANEYSRIMLDILQYRQQTKMRGEIDYMAYFTQDQDVKLLQMEYERRQHLLEKKSIEKKNVGYALSFGIGLLLLLILITMNTYRYIKASRKTGSALKLANEEITIKNELLTTNDDFKNMLISLIAHDFRVPLSNILDITTLLKMNSFTLEEASAMIVKVESAAHHTLLIFDNILRWIRSQLSGFVYHPEPCWLAGLVNIAQKGLEHLIVEKNITVSINIPPDFQLCANPEMLQFVHRNLLHNAVKFSPKGSEIVVNAVRSNGVVKVSFTDQGNGMAPDVLDNLFVFGSQRNNNAGPGKGAGLALIICKDFIAKMGGHIQAENNEGKGSTFWYSLPDKQ